MPKSPLAPPGIEALITKYLGILGMPGGPRPTIKIQNNLGSKWLGRDWWIPGQPTTILQLQRSILSDPATLERVIAHEMVHHRDNLDLAPEEVDHLRVLLRMNLKPDGHGKDFLEGAAKINAVMGAGFVTVKSDESYVLASNVRAYYLLIRPVSAASGRLGFSWAVKIMPKTRVWLARQVAEGAKLVRVTDERWLAGSSKINDRSGMNVPRPGTELEGLLRELYEKAPAVSLEGQPVSMVGVMAR